MPPSRFAYKRNTNQQQHERYQLSIPRPVVTQTPVVTPQKEIINNYLQHQIKVPILDDHDLDSDQNLQEYHSHDEIYHQLSKQYHILDTINIFSTLEEINCKTLTNALIIQNQDAYFRIYSKTTLEQILDEFHDFDVIGLCNSSSKKDFYTAIENKPSVIAKENISLDCFLLTSQGIQKFLHNVDFNDLKKGEYNRPLFLYKNKNEISSILWKSFYRVTQFFDKIYCIHLALDVNKKNHMTKYCYLLNSTESEFFYDGILGYNLPSMKCLVDMNYYTNAALSQNIKKGTLGCNITQKNIINDAVNNEYEYVLLLEDDVYFSRKYFLVLDQLFHKHKNIDILYLGISNNESNFTSLFEKIDTIYDYNILKPKKGLNQKICIGGFFAVIMSKKALKVFQERFNPIDNISDILLCDLMFDIKKDFSDAERTKTNHQLKSLVIHKDLFIVDDSKPSLTESNDFSMIQHLLLNPTISYLAKIKKLQFKIFHHYPIKIFISNTIQQWYSKLVDIFIGLFDFYEVSSNINEETDVVLYSPFDNLNINNTQPLYVVIHGEKTEFKTLCDICINTLKKKTHPFSIYFPQLFSSLWERRQPYKTFPIRDKTKFCAYMYSYDLKYRIDLYNFISTYKPVDALGKSCSQRTETDRFVYNKDITYNDIAVEKYSDYKFVLALENGVADGYITEKLINPIIAGSIPIYVGPKDVFDIINKKRVIYVYDFSSLTLLLEYIKTVDTDPVLYQSIVDENIFTGTLTWDNFEEYLKENLKKSLGFLPRNIYIGKTDSNYDVVIDNSENKMNPNDFLLKHDVLV